MSIAMVAVALTAVFPVLPELRIQKELGAQGRLTGG
jgi:hypothetical protein